MIGLALILIALILLLAIGLIGYLISVILIFTKATKEYHIRIAIELDHVGNVICGPLFNNILAKKKGHAFGYVGQTVSYVLGKNEQINKLTWLGKFIVWILNKLDPGHSEKAVISHERTEQSIKS